MLFLSAVLLFLFSIIKIRVIYYDKPKIIITFLCFDVVLYDFNKKDTKKQRFTFNNLKNLFSLVNSTLSKTEIQINRLYLPDISDIQVINGLKASLLSVIFAYISAKSVKIKADELFMRGRNFDKAEIDLTLSGRILPIGITMLKSFLKNNT